MTTVGPATVALPEPGNASPGMTRIGVDREDA